MISRAGNRLTPPPSSADTSSIAAAAARSLSHSTSSGLPVASASAQARCIFCAPARPDAAITALYKEKGAFQVATLSPALPYALFDRSVSHATYEQQENGKVVFDGIIAMARENLANGIPVGLGTDTGCPYITHYDMWRELCYFVKYCGVTPAFALHTATLLNARLAGIDGETGSIEAGKAADLIVCAKDPLADLSALRTLSMVIKDGYRVEHPAPKKLPEVERELDKFL